MPSPPRGPVPTRISLRTRSGACSAISCATMPPIEKPSTSALFKPSARLKATASARDPGVVEQDHLTVASQAIRHRRVPVIDGADVVHVENERHAAGFTESAICEADSVSLYELCRRGLVGINHHGRSLIIDSCII